MQSRLTEVSLVYISACVCAPMRPALGGRWSCLQLMAVATVAVAVVVMAAAAPFGGVAVSCRRHQQYCWVPSVLSICLRRGTRFGMLRILAQWSRCRARVRALMLLVSVGR